MSRLATLAWRYGRVRKKIKNKKKRYQTEHRCPKSEPTLELHGRAAPSVEAHHRVSGPNTGINSGGRRIIKKKLPKWDWDLFSCCMILHGALAIENVARIVILFPLRDIWRRGQKLKDSKKLVSFNENKKRTFLLNKPAFHQSENFNEEHLLIKLNRSSPILKSPLHKRFEATLTAKCCSHR